MTDTLIFEPYTLNALALPNRMVPMPRSCASNSGRMATDLTVDSVDK